MSELRKTVIALALLSLAGCGADVPRERAAGRTDLRTIPIDTTLAWGEISFHVLAEGTTLTVRPTGYSEDNRPVESRITGSVVGAEIGDLNGDGWPELLLYLASEGPAQRGTVVGFSSNGGKSMSHIGFAGVGNDPRLNKGYAGHDDFAIVDGMVVQSFPITEQGKPTGRIRQIRYRLIDGEALRLFRIDKVTDVGP